MRQERMTELTTGAEMSVGAMALRVFGVLALSVALAQPAAAQEIISFMKAFSPDTIVVGGSSTQPSTVDIRDVVKPYEDYNADRPPLRKSNGSLKIFVWNDGRWDAQGSLYFDKFYREQQIRLDLQGNTSGVVRMKLLKEGVGSAHIDAALFGGKPATALYPDSPIGLAKLATQDFDVLHGVGSAIELNFNDPGNNDILSITARTEPERLNKTPFQLPLSNLMKTMRPDADFWSYQLDSNRGSLADSLNFEAIGARAPFFKEFLKAGSGHPSDDAYGWVLNDDHNLYVVMDVTGDNTMDGDKDYAKVYVNTPMGLNSFKITESETQWGEPHFIYTDKVAYQHKVYAFRIPLEAVGLSAPADSETLQLAFAIYGTLSPNVGFSKAFLPATILVGGTSTLQFDISTATGLTNIDFTDTLPAGVVIAATPNASTDCPSASLTANAGGSTITFADGTMSAESSCTISVNVTGTTSGSMVNTTGDLTSDAGNHGTATDTLTVQAYGTIIIVKDAIPNDPQDFSFTDNIEEPNSFTLDDDTDGTLSNTRTFLSIAPGGYQVAETVPSGWVFDDSSSCSGESSFDGPTAFINVGSGETVTCTFTNLKISDVGFSKAFLPDTIGPGSTSTLTFDIDNSNNIENSKSANLVTDLAFTDVLPTGVTIATPASASTDCTNGVLSAPDGGMTISLTGGTLGANEACSVTVNVIGTATATNTSGDLTSSDGSSGTAVATLTVDAARIGFAKSFAPGTIPVGGTSMLTLDLTNNDAVPKSSLTFTDPLPTGMVVATPANTSNTCGGTLTAVPGTSLIFLSAGTVPGMSSCKITVDVTTTTPGVFVNTTMEVTSGFSPAVSGGFATAALDVQVDFLNKSFIDDPVAPGGTVTLGFTIQNPDRVNTATAIAFTDPLPAGLTAVAPLSTGTCNGTLSGTTTLSYSGGSLAGGASCTFDVTLMVPAMTAVGDYTNTTTAITATIDGEGVTGNTASNVLVVSTAPILTKTFMGDPVGAGGTIDLEFTVTNTSPTSSATDIAFQDLFDVVLPTASVTPGDGCCGVGSTCTFTPLINPPGDTTIPATLTISGASLAQAGSAGDSCTFSITLDVLTGAAAGTYANTTTEITATVDGATRLGKPASDSFDIVAAPSLVKEFTDDPVDPGDNVTLQFTLTHDATAPGDASGITFTDNLAAAISGLAATGLPLTDVCGAGNGTLTGSAGDTVLTFSGATLTPGEVCTLSVTLDVPGTATPGDYANTTSSVVATVLGVTATGNAASDDLEIAGLVLTKEFIDDPVLPGDTVTLRFTLDNVHPTDDATGIVFTDNLDAALSGLTAEAPLPDTSTCGAGSSIVGTTFLTFTGGSVDAGVSCFFDVTVRVPVGAADDTYNNVTSSVNATLGGSSFVGDPATDALIVNSDLLAFTKEFTDDPVAPGGTVTLEFVLTNQATEAVSDIAFTDDLDATLAGLVATGLPANECGGTVSTSDGGMTIDFTGGSLAAAGAAGDSCTFSVALSVPPDVLLGTTVTNTTSEVTGTLGGGEKLGVTGGPAIDELRISSLDFSKAFDGPAPAGGTVVLTFSIENLDASAGVSEIEFSDDLDLVVSGLEAIGLPVSDVCGPGSVFGGTSVLSLGGGSLGPGASCTFNVTLTVPMTAAAGTYTNITGTLFVDSAPVGVPAVADLEVVSDAAIEITKTPAQPQVFAGDSVTFTIALRNGGSVDLTNISISDPLTPDCDRVAGDLPTLVPGGETSYTCDTVPLFADLTNVATVTADIPAGPPVSASDTGAVEVLDPAVTITKTPTTQQILAGETAAFTITLTNVSDTGLINVMVSDPATPACDRSGGEGTPVLPDLAPGQSVFYVCTTDPLGSDLVNVATVTAVTREGLPVSASASAAVDVIVPIEIIKSPSEQTILPGATATFTITLNNPGTVEKTDVVVSDPLTPACDNTLASLAAGATFAYTCATGPLFADLTNIASVTAETPAGTVGASSTAQVDVIDPTIEIAKTPDVQLVLPGGTASFTVTVTNPGTDALTSIVVSDPLTPDCDFTIASLPAGGSQSKVCTTGALANDFTNVATVTATSVAGAISASASAIVNVRNPVEIIKAPAEQSVPFGGIATFTVTVTNDGDTVLTDIAVSDPLTPDCDRAAGTLGDLQPMGGQFTYTCTTDALFADLINQATVTAQGSEGTVTASDNALVDVLTDLQLTKTPADQQIEAGSAATFTITLTNGSTEVVTNIVVTDLLTPACDNAVASLNPGAVFSYDCTTEPLAFDLVNVATATGLVPGGVVSATATANVEVFQPLVITKAPAEQEILAGETADFTITVSNPSQITRTDIAVSDPLTPSCDRAAGILGDLAPGASTSYTCTTGALFADLTNVATATGQGPAGTVTVSDTAFVLVLNSEISITKTPEAQLVSPGATAGFTITLNNPGPGGLTNLSVSDPLTPDCDRAVDTLPDLPALTSTSYVCQTGPLTADFINLAAVTATSDTGLPVTATATASVNVRNPIEILKTPFEQQVPEGANAAFTITITNDGDTLKSNVAVSDPLSPDCARAAGTLPNLDPLGGSFSYTCQSGPVFTDFVNVATVTADSIDGPVTATASAFVEVVSPQTCFTDDTATGTGAATLCFTGDGSGCGFILVEYIPLEGDPLSPPAGSAPPGVIFPEGLVAFIIGEACTPGFTAEMTWELPNGLPPGTQYWKYGPTPDDPAPHWYVLPATIAGNIVTFTVTDGGLGDDDLTVNGTIVDQGGPGAPSQMIPTLSVRSAGLLAALMALLGAAILRRRFG